MAETILITNSNVQVYRSIDPTYETGRFNGFAMEAQRDNLRGLLGDSLYLDFFSGYPHASGDKYEKLLNGDTYTISSQSIKYYGLKPLLVYWWLSIATREGDMFTANHGSIEFVDNPQQTYQRAKDRDRIADSYMQTAVQYSNDLVQYLNEKSSTYPLWCGKNEENPTDFLMFKV